MPVGQLLGADSAAPQLRLYHGRSIWGVYIAGDTPHVWSRQEVRTLGSYGVRGALPIVVPPQSYRWWDNADETLSRLIAAARAWGLPAGAPLCLDIEQHQAELIGKLAPAVEQKWRTGCRGYSYTPWTYGGRQWHEEVTDPSPALKWLAEWPSQTPANPQLPPNYHAWQYSGGRTIDLDVFEAGRTYLSPGLNPVVVN